MARVPSLCVVEIDRIKAQDGGETARMSTAYRHCCDEVDVTRWPALPRLEAVVAAAINRPCPQCGCGQAIQLYVEPALGSEMPKVLRASLEASGVELLLRSPGEPTRAQRRMVCAVVEQAMGEHRGERNGL